MPYKLIRKTNRELRRNSKLNKFHTPHRTDTLLHWLGDVLYTKEKLMLSRIKGARSGTASAIRDFRVSARRFYTTLEIFQRCFPKKHIKTYSRMLRDVIRGLGRVREYDIVIVMLQEFQATLPAGEKFSLDPVIASRLNARNKQHRNLLPHLKKFEKNKYRSMLGEILQRSDSPQ